MTITAILILITIILNVFIWTNNFKAYKNLKKLNKRQHNKR